MYRNGVGRRGFCEKAGGGYSWSQVYNASLPSYAVSDRPAIVNKIFEETLAFSKRPLKSGGGEAV